MTSYKTTALKIAIIGSLILIPQITRAQTVAPCTTTSTATSPITTNETPAATPTSQPIVATTTTTTTTPTVVPTTPTNPRISLSELLPDPIGTDADGEFIELANAEAVAINLAGWKVTNSKTASYTFPSVTIPANGFLAIPYQTSKVTLTNTGGTYVLFDASQTQIDAVTYGQTIEGKSYAKVNGTWKWTTPTPNVANLEPIADAANPTPTTINSTTPTTSITDQTATPTDSTTPTNTISTASPTTASLTTADAPATTNNFNNPAATQPASQPVCNCNTSNAGATTIDIGDISNYGSGSKVIVEGMVTTPLGALSKTTFALEDYDGENGTIVRVRGTLPKLIVGQTILLSGVVRKSKTSSWLETSGKTIKKLGVGEISPQSRDLADLADEDIGTLISIAGQLTKGSSNWGQLTSEDGKNTIKLRLPTSPLAIPSKSNIIATGVIRKFRGKLEMVLFENKNIVLVKNETPKPVESSPLDLTPITVNSDSKLLGYAPIAGIAVAFGVALSYYWIMEKRKKNKMANN